MTNDLNRPNKPTADKYQATDVIRELKSRIKFLVDKGMTAISCEEAQSIIEELDTLFKELSKLQFDSAPPRKLLSQYCQNLRKSRPKARLSEGSEIVRNGRTYMLLNECLYEIKSHKDVEKET